MDRAVRGASVGLLRTALQEELGVNGAIELPGLEGEVWYGFNASLDDVYGPGVCSRNDPLLPRPSLNRGLPPKIVRTHKRATTTPGSQDDIGILKRFESLLELTSILFIMSSGEPFYLRY